MNIDFCDLTQEILGIEEMFDSLKSGVGESNPTPDSVDPMFTINDVYKREFLDGFPFYVLKIPINSWFRYVKNLCNFWDRTLK